MPLLKKKPNQIYTGITQDPLSCREKTNLIQNIEMGTHKLQKL